MTVAEWPTDWRVQVCELCRAPSGWRVHRDVPVWICVGCQTRTNQVEGTCLAMSRFLVWVWCEALSEEEWGYVPSKFDARAGALASALMRGLLRLEWPR